MQEIHSSLQTENQIVNKILWRLMPVLFVGFVIAFLDRTNIGMAALTMKDDLGLSATMLGRAAGMFSIAYCLLELPSNLILHRVGARIWISRILITWGLVGFATAWVQGEWSLYLMRLLLGAAEAGFSPGIILFLTYWIPERYRSRALAIFLVGAPISSVIGSPISGIVLGLDGLGGLKGWQWLFILQSLPAILLGIFCLSYFQDNPSKARWLSEQEKETVLASLAWEQKKKSESERYSLRDMLIDPRILIVSLANMLFICGLFGVLFWLPQIIKSYGVSNAQVGWLNAIPYLLGAVAMIVWAKHSDRTNERYWHVATAAIVAAAGLLGSAIAHTLLVSLACITIAAIGIFSVMEVIFVIPTLFLTGRGVAGGVGIMGVIGNLGGFIGPYVFGVSKDATGGFTAALVAAAFSLLGTALCMFALRIMAPKVSTSIPTA